MAYRIKQLCVHASIYTLHTRVPHALLHIVVQLLRRHFRVGCRVTRAFSTLSFLTAPKPPMLSSQQHRVCTVLLSISWCQKLSTRLRSAFGALTQSSKQMLAHGSGSASTLVSVYIHKHVRVLGRFLVQLCDVDGGGDGGEWATCSMGIACVWCGVLKEGRKGIIIRVAVAFSRKGVFALTMPSVSWLACSFNTQRAFCVCVCAFLCENVKPSHAISRKEASVSKTSTKFCTPIALPKNHVLTTPRVTRLGRLTWLTMAYVRLCR